MNDYLHFLKIVIEPGMLLLNLDSSLGLFNQCSSLILFSHSSTLIQFCVASIAPVSMTLIADDLWVVSPTFRDAWFEPLVCPNRDEMFGN